MELVKIGTTGHEELDDFLLELAKQGIDITTKKIIDSVEVVADRLTDINQEDTSAITHND